MIAINPSTPILEVHPGDVALFFDKRSGRDYDATLNQVGIVTELGVLVIRKSLIGRWYVDLIPLQDMPALKNLEFRRPQKAISGDRIEQYFLTHRERPLHFAAGLRALRNDNLQPLRDNELFPASPTYANDEQYEIAWTAFVAALNPMDTLFTACKTEPMSRFIAWYTGGPWSHVAVYVGNGEIWESVTSGVRTCSVDVYKGRQFRVGAYRHIGLLNETKTYEQALAVVSTPLWRPGTYNYRCAAWHGTKSFFGFHEHALVPNSFIYQGIYSFLRQV